MEEESKNQTNTPPPQRLSVPKKSDLVLSAVSNLHQSKENSEEDQINSVNRASNNMCLRCNAEINAVLVFCGFDNRGEARGCHFSVYMALIARGVSVNEVQRSFQQFVTPAELS